MKVLMVVNTDGALYIFRKPIIEKLVAEGHEVVTISPESRYFDKIRSLGARPISLGFSRESTAIHGNLALFKKLRALIEEERPDIVHSFTHKPAIFASIAARFAGVKKIFVTITGLGNLFVRNDLKTRILKIALLLQYKFALRYVDTVFFQNPDDMAYFEKFRIVPEGRSFLTAGSGLDLQEFELPTPEKIISARNRLAEEVGVDLAKRRLVLFPARGTPEKGFFDFYEAAKIINKIEPDTYIFLHLGLVDAQGSWHFSKEGLAKYAKECGVYYLGFKDDIQTYMCAADIVALPSKYREGTPRSLIEALGLGKVIVTTDMPGCRETVIDGWNGYLCAPGKINDFVSRILMVDDDLIKNSIARSRRYCEEKFNAHIVVGQTLKKYGV